MQVQLLNLSSWLCLDSSFKIPTTIAEYFVHNLNVSTTCSIEERREERKEEGRERKQKKGRRGKSDAGRRNKESKKVTGHLYSEVEHQ